MHGNEAAPRRILRDLRDGGPITASTCGWCRPTTPTGSPRGTRKNAHGVDLNRNYPYQWADLDGNYESGPRPGLRARDPGDDARSCATSRPTCVLSFHQPLHGVDTDTKTPRLLAPGRARARPARASPSTAAASATAP